MSEQLNVLSPKRYERIFNIPVDFDKFEIDTKKTYETPSGAKQFNELKPLNPNETATKLFWNNGKWYMRHNKNDINISKLWITISGHAEK